MAKKSSGPLYRSPTLITPKFRGSYVSVFKPQPGMNGGAEKYQLSAIFEPKKYKGKDAKRWKAILAELDKATQAGFGVDWEELGEGKFRNHKTGLRDGVEKDGSDGYGKGKMFANLTTTRKPSVGILNDEGEIEEISREADNMEEIYSGAYYRATVTIMAYSNDGKGISFGLNSLLKVEDGEPLGGSGGNVMSDFEDEVESEMDDEDDDAPRDKKSKKKKSKKSRDDDDEDEDDEDEDDEDEDEDEDDEPRGKKSKSKKSKKSKKKSRYDDEDEDEDEDDED